MSAVLAALEESLAQITVDNDDWECRYGVTHVREVESKLRAAIPVVSSLLAVVQQLVNGWHPAGATINVGAAVFAAARAALLAATNEQSDPLRV